MNKIKTQKSQIALFFLRMFFYLSVLILLGVHPGIAISFDRIGIIQWFIIIPMQAVFAFFPYPKVRLKYSFIIAGVPLLILSLIAGGFSLTALWPFLAGVISFFLTLFLFHYPRFGKLSLLEPFLLVWICLRLLSLSRSGEEIAGLSNSLTQFILVWSAAVFLLHSVVVYFCLYPNSIKGSGKESALFFLGTAAVLVLVLAVLPPDFIRNSIVENLNRGRAPQKIGDESDRGFQREEGRRGRRPREGNGNRRPELLGMSEYEWQSGMNGSGNNRRERNGGGSGDAKQYLVKIVISETEPVYMADSFKGKLDPVYGFLLNDDDPLNELSKQRLFSTWFNHERNLDSGRTRLEIFSLSTLQEKFLPYWVYSIDPTIINEDAGPLRYIHQVVSDIHNGNPLELVFIPSRSLNYREEQALSGYLDIELNREDLQLFNNWLDNAFSQWQETRSEFFINPDSENDELFSDTEQFKPVNDYLEKILAILTGFSEYQYNLSYIEEASVERIKEFLFTDKDGDCVEFSNSLALLGRIAGIPSRVVTGYLASEELQSIAHLQGLSALQRQIPFLQLFPFENLFMVTNYHAHSWTQFYIPDYGWLDFEATSFALPPLPSEDPGNFDVVIPIIETGKAFSDLRKFPWRAVLRALGLIALTALCGAYILRYGREAALRIGAKKGGRDGARALYLLLLARLAADGKPIKPASKTAAEYSLTRRHGGAAELKDFALLYSELRWRKFEDKNEMDKKFELLKKEYLNILNTTKRRGIGWWLVRIISLRGLAYL